MLISHGMAFFFGATFYEGKFSDGCTFFSLHGMLSFLTIKNLGLKFEYEPLVHFPPEWKCVPEYIFSPLLQGCGEVRFSD